MENCRLRIVHVEPWTRDEGLASQWTGSLDEECVKARAKAFALRVTRLAESLPMTGAAGLCGDELLQSATLIRANCQDACRAMSDDDFQHKLGHLAEEARECGAWLELLAETDVVKRSKLDELTEEADELVAVVAETIRSTPGNEIAEVGSQDSEVPRLRLSSCATASTSPSRMGKAGVLSSAWASRPVDRRTPACCRWQSTGGVLDLPSARGGQQRDER